MKYPLRFGIPGLDRLLGDHSEKQQEKPEQKNFGFSYSSDAGTSFCLIGPHGSGKSVLALHFASRYFADCLREKRNEAKVFYVSTDLSHAMALNVWKSFALDVPESRVISPGECYKREEETGIRDEQIVLQRRTPEAEGEDKQNLAAYLARCPGASGECQEITFVDLAAASAGDDWGFIHRLIAVLNQPPSGTPRHLVVVDAVEGLETLVGEKDAFGEITSRRSRVAQMLRTAFNKCHLFLVVEEPAEGQRVPEEFVSDVVVRLRSVHHRGFDRRTVEVQKVRGQGQVRGQHPYIIRQGVGSYTGSQMNLDDRLFEMPKNAMLLQERGIERLAQAYVHVMHSLHFLTRSIMLGKGPSRPNPSKRFADFGITHLDGMLGRGEAGAKGLPCSTITALIGDAGTHKSVLGKRFLYRGLYAEIIKDPDPKKASTGDTSVAILLTTNDIDAVGLAKRFLRWAGLEQKQRLILPKEKINQLVTTNIICRRLEVHNQTSEVLMHVVRSAVSEAQIRIGVKPEDNSRTRYAKSWRIRLVVDDFSVLKGMYPDVREDSLFLPYLTFYLRREGISTLIIDTHPGRPDREGPALFDDELRALADNHLYTWRVGFHGESRIAISAIPPIHATERSRIRELKCDEIQKLPPVVDRELELYTGLEQGNPSPIPLEVRLYAETDLFADYIAEMNIILGDFFVTVPRNNSKEIPRLVLGIKPNEYSYLHDFCNLQSDHALDHTLILAVDESWAVRSIDEKALGIGNAHPPHPLRDEREYLAADLDIFGSEPRQMFRGPRFASSEEVQPDASGPRVREKGRDRRASYFHLPGGKLIAKDNPVELMAGIDRIPFAWDFGFLMCRAEPWRISADEPVLLRNAAAKTVGQILAELPGGEPRQQSSGDHELAGTNANRTRPRWRDFLGACDVVSKRFNHGDKQGLPFDLSTITGETFSCLILEMWASEILDRLLEEARSSKRFLRAKDLVNALCQKAWAMPAKNAGLVHALRNKRYVIDLYLVWLLLVDLLPLDELANPDHPTQVVQRVAPATAIASRQWYTTACQLLTERRSGEPMLAIGLPGHFSARGDWFLGVARGSKSDLLADRVLDIFSSRRNNLTRLYSGLGLPTRILGPREETGRLLTALAWKDDTDVLRRIRYGELLALGAGNPVTEVPNGFYWLFRSALCNYHKHSRIFHRWNSRTILMWNETKAQAGSWIRGFELYDRLLEGGRPEDEDEMNDKVKAITNEDRNSWTHFAARCEILKQLLIHSDETEPLPDSQIT